MSFKVYYRLSDKGRAVEKPSYINLENCLNNFLQYFDKDEITIIADNIEDSTFQTIKSIGFDNIDRTNTGNALGFIETLKRCISENVDNTIIYLVEDDYLHLSGSKKNYRRRNRNC